VPNPAREYVPRVIRHLQQHQLYGAIFETGYLEYMRGYYASQRALYKDPREFLLYSVKKVQEEVDRATAVLPESSHAAVRSTAETALMSGNAEWLANGGASRTLQPGAGHGSSRYSDLFHQ
jgi:hypothetical protein